MDRVTIELPDELADLLRSAVDRGGYASQSEVVAEALQVWDERRQYSPEAIEKLRAMVDKSLASGPSEPLDMAEIRRKAREAFERGSA